MKLIEMLWEKHGNKQQNENEVSFNVILPLQLSALVIVGRLTSLSIDIPQKSSTLKSGHNSETESRLLPWLTFFTNRTF